MRRVFFSFHYERDASRAGVVRNSWLTKEDREAAGYVDAVQWETIRRQGDAAIRNWINNQLQGTSVTVVLIGAETSTRRWVDYEIQRSIEDRKGLLGIYIHNIRDLNQNTDRRGQNPLNNHEIMVNGRRQLASSYYKTYDWIENRGYDNLGAWVEEAAKLAGR